MHSISRQLIQAKKELHDHNQVTIIPSAKRWGNKYERLIDIICNLEERLELTTTLKGN